MKTGAEAIRALATQLPVFRQKLSDGWYQVRIAGRDVSTSGLTAQLHETLPDGAVIHIVPRVAGAKSGGVFQIVLGAAAIAGSFFTAGATLAAWGAAIGAGGMTGILFSLGASMVLGGVAQMLAPKARTPRTQTTDNGNHSAVHWDLICIQTPEYGGGEIWFDDVLIRKDGMFVLDELKCLNPENLI